MFNGSAGGDAYALIMVFEGTAYFISKGSRFYCNLSGRTLVSADGGTYGVRYGKLRIGT